MEVEGTSWQMATAVADAITNDPSLSGWALSAFAAILGAAGLIALRHGHVPM